MDDEKLLALRFNQKTEKWELLQCVHCGRKVESDDEATWFLDDAGRLLCPACSPVKTQDG